MSFVDYQFYNRLDHRVTIPEISTQQHLTMLFAWLTINMQSARMELSTSSHETDML